MLISVREARQAYDRTIAGLDKIQPALDRLYPNRENSDRWLLTPHRLLAGRCALECLQEGDVDDVVRVLEQLEKAASE